MNSHLFRGVSPRTPLKKVYGVLDTVISFVYVKCHVCVHILSFLLDKVDLFAHKLFGAIFTLEIKKRKRDIK